MKVTNLKYYNASINQTDFSGSTYAPYLHGNIGDRLKVEFDIEVESFAKAEAGNPITVTGSSPSFNLTWGYGSFIELGFFSGQNYELRDSLGVLISEGTIIYVDPLTIDLNETGGSGLAAGTLNSDEKLICIDDLAGLIYRPNILENSDSFSTNSIIDGQGVEYYISNLAISGSYSAMTRKGLPHEAVTGNVEVKYVSNTNGVHSLKIREYFIIPFWCRDWEDDYQAGNPPPQFTASYSLKHVFEIIARHDYNNPNSQVTGIWENTKGSVGWYNESFSGNTPAYSIDSISYIDTVLGNTVDGLSINRRTRISLSITSLLGDINTDTYAYVFLASAISNYGTKVHDEAFLADRLGALSDSGVSGTGKIKLIQFDTTSPTTADINITVEYEDSDKTLFDYKTIPYIVGLSLCDTSLSVSASDKTTLLVGYNPYEYMTDVSGLLEWNETVVYAHDKPSTPFTDYKGWPNSSLKVSSNFAIAPFTKLSGLKVQIIASDGSNEFQIDSRDINLGNSVFDLSGKQYLSVDTIRGFRNKSNDPMSQVVVSVNNSGSYSVFDLAFGMNISWQDWISNPKVSALFIDLAEPQRNLNKKASNYDNANGYQVYVRVLAQIEQDGNVTEYAQDVETELYDYGVDADVLPNWQGEVKIFQDSVETGVIDKAGKCTVKIIMSPADLGDLDLSGYVGVIRLEKKNQPDEDYYEIDTAKLYDQTVLLPPDGETYATLDISGTSITIEAQIDGTKLERNVDYVVYGRLYHDGGEAPIAEFTTHAHLNGSDGTIEIPVRLKKADNTTALGAGKEIEVEIIIDSVTVETLTGTVGQDISAFDSDLADDSFSVISFATGNMVDSGVVTWKKKVWANKNLLVNYDSTDVTWQIRAKDYGQWSTPDTELITQYTKTPGYGLITAIAKGDGNDYYITDYNNGIRLLNDNGTTAYTNRLHTKAACSKIAVDLTTPTNPKVFTIDSDAAGATNKVYWVNNTNRLDKGGNGVPNQHILSFKGQSIAVIDGIQVNSMPNLWVGGRDYNGKLFVLSRTSPTAYAEYDFSSLITAITGWTGASITNILVDANDDIWVFGHVAGSGNGLVKISKTGGGAYTDVAQWTASRVMSFNGDALTLGDGTVCGSTNPMQQASIIGYDSTYGAVSGTNPIFMWGSYSDTVYPILKHNGGSSPDLRLNFTLSTPSLLSGTPASTTWGTGTGSTEIGNARLCLLDGTTFYGGGNGSPDRVIIRRKFFNNSGGTQDTAIIFGGGAGYDEQQRY